MTPACFICTNSDVFGELSMLDKDLCERAARNLIQGMVSTKRNKGNLRNFQSTRRRGTSVVERCARTIEAACAACQEPGCQRCVHAAELRAAADRIDDERDAELLELGVEDEDLEELVDVMIGNLCEDHAPFGAVLAGQWYGRRSFLVPSMRVNS